MLSQATEPRCARHMAHMAHLARRVAAADRRQRSGLVGAGFGGSRGLRPRTVSRRARERPGGTRAPGRAPRPSRIPPEAGTTPGRGGLPQAVAPGRAPGSGEGRRSPCHRHEATPNHRREAWLGVAVMRGARGLDLRRRPGQGGANLTGREPPSGGGRWPAPSCTDPRKHPEKRAVYLRLKQPRHGISEAHMWGF